LCAEKRQKRQTEEYKNYIKDYRDKNRDRINQLKRLNYLKNKDVSE